MTKQEFLAMSYPYEIKLVYRNDKSWPIIMAIGNLDEILHTNKDYKPILRPLSDLTKEIEHRGEKFVPYKKLDWDKWDGEIGEYISFGDSHAGVINPLNQLNQLQFLVSWHFDIANLISTGEAIDINTLEVNPYK